MKDIVEVKVGYDGIVLAHSKKAPAMKVTRKDVYLALAKQIPDPANPTDADREPEQDLEGRQPSLPAEKIEVLGPPPTSGTRDSFVELFMEAAAPPIAWIKTLKDMDEPRFKRVCDTCVRTAPTSKPARTTT